MPENRQHMPKAYGVACREIRAIRRKSNYLKPSLQKAKFGAYRKDARNRYQPLRWDSDLPTAILRGKERCPVRVFKETDGTPTSR
jgi:hypothetical protein